MKLIELKVLRGPNYWSIKKTRLIQMLLDLEELEFLPTNKIPGFYERIQKLLPSLHNHECSEARPGGFFIRVKDGTWMGHVIEHIAIEIQNLAGMELGFGRTRGAGSEGLYHVVFSYAEETAGLYAAHAALRIAQALVDGKDYDVEQDIKEIKQLWTKERLGPSTMSIVAEAQKRGIPFMRLDDGALVQLGYGARQKKIEAALTSATSSIAVDIAGDKNRTKEILKAAHVPVPAGEIITEEAGISSVVESIGFPIVIKPLNGNQGKGATTNITSLHEAFAAFRHAKAFSEKVIVEKFIQGNDYRVLVINYKYVAAAFRRPALVIGDGEKTIRELVDEVNQDPKRGDNHDDVLTRIDLDEVCRQHIKKNGYDVDTVLAPGEVCYLKPTANLSTGGTAADITDEVHPSNILLFERIARAIGLDICGIDIMAPDLKTPIAENGGSVLEVNAAPGFRMHLCPTIGLPRNVAAPVIDMLFQSSSRIPIVAITGTNGKTTTTRLVAAMACQAGYTTGYTTTDGIYINKELVTTGDCSGPGSAEFILKDPSVEFAVLETARGGILRSGLAFDQCDAAIITNIAEDHLGLNGIDCLEKLAKVKAVVAETVCETGYAILNADDDLVYSMKDQLKCRVALFSLYSDNVRIEEHCSQGGIAAVLENGYLLLRVGNYIIPIEEVRNVPITFGGKAEFNIANVLAASLAAYTTHIKLNTIKDALRNFVHSEENTPGRVNIYEFNDFSVMLDYAHNQHGVKALGKFIRSVDAAFTMGIITGVGDRRDEDIIALGEESAKIFDGIIVRHDADLRGRTPEELDQLLTIGINKVDPGKPITYCWDECEAVRLAIQHAEPNSLIVALTDNIKKVTECIRQVQQDHQSQLKTAI
jgi:cyanophycin synthetase